MCTQKLTKASFVYHMEPKYKLIKKQQQQHPFDGPLSGYPGELVPER